jgi:hypothetical protein
VAAFRQRLTDNPAPVHVGNRRRYELTMELLDRLERHPDAEKVYNVIKSKWSVEQFIATVVRDRLQAEELAKIREQASDADAKIRARTKRYLQGDYDDFQLAAEINALGEFKQQLKQLKLREKTGPRTGFMANWRAHFKRLCGQPHDRIVALLTNIVFDLKGDDVVTAGAVRGARYLV